MGDTGLCADRLKAKRALWLLPAEVYVVTANVLCLFLS